MRLSKIVSLVCIVLGVLFYLQGVLGLLWPRSPPLDVGLLSTSALFVLFGLVGLLLDRKPAVVA
ncbi:MAG TPA: hypothetical protein VM286_09940 [Candidatus Thermoplasmatota archaeon]|nr:hypothetical protein [Candidatus Thermoplasmatota archaeon]